MSEAKVDLTVQSSQAESAWQRYSSAVEAVLAVDRKRADEDKKASQAAAEYGRVKSRVLSELETATGRYGRKLGELERMSAAGDLSAEQFSQGLKKIQTELDGSNPALAEAAQRQRELARSAQQVLQAIQTPFEGYRQRVAGLNTQLQAGLLTQEQYNRAIRQAREELVKGSTKIDERKRKEQELATQQQRVIEAITTPQDRYNRQLAILNTLRQQNKLSEEQYGRAVAHTKQQLEQSTKAGVSGANTMNEKLLGLATGYLSIQGGLTFWMNANEKLLTQANELGDKYDTALRTFRLLAGLNERQGAEARVDILKQAREGANTSEEADQVANALSSTGFSSEQIQGGAVRQVLKISNAQAVAGKKADFGAISESISRYLESQGMEKTEANIEMIGQRMQALKATPLKITDLEHLAKNAAGLRGKMSVDDQLASFAQLMGIEQGSEAGTHLRNVASRLSTAGAQQDTTQALRRIKLKPEDVDMVGETFDEAIAKVHAGVQKLPEAQRENVLVKLFDREALPAFSKLALDAEQRAGFKNDMKDTTLVDKDAAIFEEGRAAGKRRLELDNQLAKLKRDDEGDLHGKSLETKLLESGASPAQTAAGGIVQSIDRFLGGDNVQAAAAGATGASLLDSRMLLGPVGLGMKYLGIGGKSLQEESEIAVGSIRSVDSAKQPRAAAEEKMVAAIEANNEKLDENTKAMKDATKVVQPAGRANTKPPGPRPAAVGLRP